MIRMQSSWLLESVEELLQVDSVAIPFFHRFSALNWLSHLEIPLFVNFPVDSQAMLARAWFDVNKGPFLDKNLHKFNQLLTQPLNKETNPFEPWLDKFFTRQQIDYIYYWRESAYEIEDYSQREIFWSAVYQVMSYWLTNKKYRTEVFFEPDKIMAYYLHYHNEFIRGKQNKVEITSKHLSELEAKECSLVLFPLIFDDDTEEDLLQIIYYAWFHGHADIKLAKKEISLALNRYMIPFNAKSDYSKFLELAEKAASAAFCWTGKELAPRIHEQVIAEPIRNVFKTGFSKSKLYMKSVDKTTDTYDYLLVFKK